MPISGVIISSKLVFASPFLHLCTSSVALSFTICRLSLLLHAFCGEWIFPAALSGSPSGDYTNFPVARLKVMSDVCWKTGDIQNVNFRRRSAFSFLHGHLCHEDNDLHHQPHFAPSRDQTLKLFRIIFGSPLDRNFNNFSKGVRRFARNRSTCKGTSKQCMLRRL
jgi:hypothetical protein